MQARIPFPALRRAGPGVGDTGAASSGIRQFLKLPKAWLQIAGVAVLLAPLVRGKRWGDFDWRLAYLSSVLMWVVVYIPALPALMLAWIEPSAADDA